VTSAGATVQPLERAHLVWRRAVALSTPTPSPAPTPTRTPTLGQDDQRFGLVLDLLRTAHHGPSTMLDALALGREQQRSAPGDLRIRDAVRLLTRTIQWFGRCAEDHDAV
jgi:hypothetical protein